MGRFQNSTVLDWYGVLYVAKIPVVQSFLLLLCVMLALFSEIYAAAVPPRPVLFGISTLVLWLLFSSRLAMAIKS